MAQTFSKLLIQSGLPPIEARVLLQSVSTLTHAQLIARALDSVPINMVEKFQKIVKKRKGGWPVAYLVKTREFYKRLFFVNQATLIPRQETELLVDTALSLSQNQSHQNVLDLGTGTGIVAITLALERPHWSVTATDISETTIQVAQKNIKTHDAPVSLVKGNWFSPFEAQKTKWDMIVSNPPYIAINDKHLKIGDLRFEPLDALTDHKNGLAYLTLIAQEAPRHLLSQGWLLLEHGATQGSAVRLLLKKNGFQKIQTHCDLSNHERVTFGQFLLR